MIQRLLSTDFSGSAELREQFRYSRVRSIDALGGLDIVPSQGPSAPVVERVPTEGTALDSDGILIYFLLHVVQGRLKELEIFKADGSDIKKMPTQSVIALRGSTEFP